MASFKKTNFKKAVKKNLDKQKTENTGFGYLRLPKGVSFYKEKEGKSFLDFIPYVVKSEKHLDRDPEGEFAVPGTLWYRLPFRVHKNVGVGNETVVCPTTFGKKCPICEHRQRRKEAGADQDELKALNISKRSLYAVIPLKDAKLEEKVHIWDVSDFLFQDLLNEELEENEDYLAFPGLSDGYTLKVRFEEESFNKNKFYKAGRIDFLERKKQYKDSIVDQVPCLEDLLTIHDYKQLEALFFQTDDVDDEDDFDEDDDSTKRKKKSTKKVEKTSKKKPSKDEDEDEEDVDEPDDEDDDEEEDEEEKSVKTRTRSSKKTKKEDDDEDDDSDEDEDDEDDEDEDEDEEDVDEPDKESDDEDEEKESDDEDEEKEDEDESDEEDTSLKLPKDLIKLMNWRVSYKGFAGMVVAVNPGERTCTIKNGEDKTKVGVPISKLTLIKSWTPPAAGPRPGKESGKDKNFSRKNKCPHGHTYYKDNDKHKACRSCKVWDQCADNE